MSDNHKQSAKSQHWYQTGAIVWLLALILTGVVRYQNIATPPQFVMSANGSQGAFEENTPFLIQSDVSRTTRSVHASTLAEIKVGDGRKLMTAWFQGSREGARDVEIYASFLTLQEPLGTSPTQNLWSAPKSILTPQMLAEQSRTHIKKLGNPVLYQSRDGTIHLFVVATSYAGWAASKIYHLTSTTGEHFDFKQILPLSPFLNVSHLVRVPPVSLADGGFYLPIYHELANKFELILRFNKDGELIAKIRPNALTGLLQPALTPISKDDCVMARRHRHSAPLLIQECHQGGLVWDKPTPTNVNNDNNSLNLVHFNNTNYLIHNQTKDENSRYYLWLSKLTKNNNDFVVQKYLLLDTANTGEVSYPTTVTLGNEMHIVYTHDRQSIRHIVVNQSFLDKIGDCELSVNQGVALSNKQLGDLSNQPMIIKEPICKGGL